MLQARHFQAIADTIREMLDAGYRADVAVHFADRMQWYNPKFKRERFLKACDVDTSL